MVKCTTSKHTFVRYKKQKDSECFITHTPSFSINIIITLYTYSGSGVPSLLVVVIGVLAAAILILIITTLSLVLCLRKWGRKRRGKSPEIAAIFM